MDCTMFDNRNDVTFYSFPETAHPTIVTAVDPCAAVALNAYLDPTLINWDMQYVDSLVKMDPTSQDSPLLPEPSLAPLLPPVDSGMMLSPSCLPPPLLIPSFASAANLTPPSADYLPIFWDKQPDMTHTILPISSEGDCLSPPSFVQIHNTQSIVASSPQSVESAPINFFSLPMTSIQPEEILKPSEAPVSVPVQGKIKSTKHLRRHTISTSTVSAQRKPSAPGTRTRRSSQCLSSEEVQAKKMVRLERNRLAACKSRQKRKMLTDDQLAALKILEDDTAKIEQENRLLQAQLANITEFLKNHHRHANINTQNI
ncbi:hypothetical protein CONCODRAFT_79848 [Conidiobolus coronatus NRRL 28638]|uniref:BZIP domain-containing protein n=1 Tax=Conidiobolus coronatus (strain ATCC 28846 / CBS 209.66 / NRRL 28638) TaxID=796925 RepID=A0A137P026_CONC2|nr:hypothetical protein CONCODRAFT_79848 [Conidiobolus coronatus NRRL 28638]|eukprot:KXN68219.1 hypothetical protein CONCODRAFT_79848 [Conidiobolus coronatus NRRL 28638]